MISLSRQMLEIFQLLALYIWNEWTSFINTGWINWSLVGRTWNDRVSFIWKNLQWMSLLESTVSFQWMIMVSTTMIFGNWMNLILQTVQWKGIRSLVHRSCLAQVWCWAKVEARYFDDDILYISTVVTRGMYSRCVFIYTVIAHISVQGECLTRRIACARWS